MASGPRPLVSNAAAMTPAATQEPLTEQGSAAAAAPVAVRTRWPRPFGSRTLVARDRRRVRRQQIIAAAARVNRDASLFLAAPGSGPSGRHASAGHEGSPDSAGRRPGGSAGALVRHSSPGQ